MQDIPTNAVHFARVPAAAIFDKRVKRAELRVIGAIASYADKDGFAFPAVTTLAIRLGVSRAAIQKQIRMAEEHGYITTKRRKHSKLGGDTSNLYQVHFSLPIEASKTSVDEKCSEDSYPPSDKVLERRWIEIEANACGATLEVALPKDNKYPMDSATSLVALDWSIEAIRTGKHRMLHPRASIEVAQTDQY